MESSRRALAFGSVKTRFKAIFEKLGFSVNICFFFFFMFFATGGRLFCPKINNYLFNERLPPEGDFSAQNVSFLWTFAPGGRLSYEAYNVFTFFNLHLHYIYIYIYIYITFTFHLHLHLHFIDIFNLHLHLIDIVNLHLHYI